MGRKRADSVSSAPTWDWFLADWMKSLGINQTTLRDRADWSKTAASEICSGKTGYSKRLVNEAAHALNIHPYELLMHPDDAMALRRMRQEALRIVESSRDLDADSEPAAERKSGGS